MNLPEKIAIDATVAKRLTGLADKQAALNGNIAACQKNWEMRGAELQAEGRALWDEIAKLYKLDVQRVNYTISPDGQYLVPTMVRL